jgi:hypothetical protein
MVTGKLQSPAERDLARLAGRMLSRIAADDKSLTWDELGRLICGYGD